MSFCLKIIYILSYSNDAIDNEFADATPYERVEVLFVMEFDLLAWATHERVGNGFVGYRELKLVALDAWGYAIGCLTFETCLDEFAFVGFEDIALVDHIVELASFYAFTKYEEVLEIDDSCNDQYCD